MFRNATVLLLLLVITALPSIASAAVPAPRDIEIIDIPNDGGSGVGLLWNWSEPADDATVLIEVMLTDSILDEFRLDANEQTRLDDALAKLREELASVLPDLKAAKTAMDAATDAATVALNDKSPEYYQLLRAQWVATNEHARWQDKLNAARDRLTSRSQDLEGKLLTFESASAILSNGGWTATDFGSFDPVANGFVGVPAAFSTKSDKTRLFGHTPTEPDKLFAAVETIQVIHPDVYDGSFSSSLSEYGIQAVPSTSFNVNNESTYQLRMTVFRGDESQVFDLGSLQPKWNKYNTGLTINLLFSILFGLVIMVSIMVARRNPNLFIRRIQGLEAVDEAIGRATEMGKPVLYLCGLDSLATLSTLAAVNILGRVARRIADYDSDLIVPCRDPVVLSVAQEVVKEAYVEQGRPDAYREDKLFFVTDDQFSFTATTCAIMMREKPAANFFMGYYYAESLLLAETGASTGAIQIAGTDATHQLPFFITTCDYTLIGEELYAASAYMSREPMLLGSLKGQDIGKAFILLIILVQTILFIFSPDWNWIQLLVKPL